MSIEAFVKFNPENDIRVSGILASVTRFRPVGTLLNYLKLRRQWRIDRQAFDNLLLLNDAILQDIGTHREDVLRASRLPLRKNAALELKKFSTPAIPLGKKYQHIP